MGVNCADTMKVPVKADGEQRMQESRRRACNCPAMRACAM
jgi:hypothetical protein